MDNAGSPPAHDVFRRLTRTESLSLLATAQVGRLIFTLGALPAVRVMNFALVGQQIVMRTAAHTTVARSITDTIVAFEVDELDVAASSGWSVTVTGRATLVTDPELIDKYKMVPLVPWAAGVRDLFVVITTEKVEGQRVAGPAVHAGAAGPAEAAGAARAAGAAGAAGAAEAAGAAGQAAEPGLVAGTTAS